MKIHVDYFLGQKCIYWKIQEHAQISSDFYKKAVCFSDNKNIFLHYIYWLLCDFCLL